MFLSTRLSNKGFKEGSTFETLVSIYVISCLHPIDDFISKQAIAQFD